MASESLRQYSLWLDMTLNSKWKGYKAQCCKREGPGHRFEDSLRDEHHTRVRVGQIRINCQRKSLNAFTAIYSNTLSYCYKSVDSQRSASCTQTGFFQFFFFTIWKLSEAFTRTWPALMYKSTRTVSTLSAKLVSFGLVCSKCRKKI